MTVRHQNYSGKLTPDVIDVRYEHCNFSQPQPAESGGKKIGVRIFPLDNTSRIFADCNLNNCELPPGSIKEGRCTQKVIERGVVKTTSLITVNAKLMGGVKEYVNVLYGKYDHNNKIQYLPIPREMMTDPPRIE